MKIVYFKDTDTLVINFNDNQIAETKDLNENILIELDSKGLLVSMTVEHAAQQVEIPDFSFKEISSMKAAAG